MSPVGSGARGSAHIRFCPAKGQGDFPHLIIFTCKTIFRCFRTAKLIKIILTVFIINEKYPQFVAFTLLYFSSREQNICYPDAYMRLKTPVSTQFHSYAIKSLLNNKCCRNTNL